MSKQNRNAQQFVMPERNFWMFIDDNFRYEHDDDDEIYGFHPDLFIGMIGPFSLEEIVEEVQNSMHTTIIVVCADDDGRIFRQATDEELQS